MLHEVFTDGHLSLGLMEEREVGDGMKCRCCAHQMQTIGIIYDWHGVSEMRLERQPFEMPPVPMQFYVCPYCTHIQAETMLEDTYYQTHDTQAEGNQQYMNGLNHDEARLDRLIRYAPEAKTYLEIGCGSGRFLQKAAKRFPVCVGVEPSPAAEVAAKIGGIKVLKGFFDHRLRLKEKYDAITAFQVFEHLTDPRSVLRYALECMSDSAIGLLNVPNGQQILETAQYTQVITQHVNYYTPQSMTALVKSAGGELVSVELEPDTMEMNCFFRKKREYPSLETVAQQHRREILRMCEGKRVAVWGTGRKGPAYANLMKGLPMMFLFDSDEKKTGYYMANVARSIELPSKEKLAQVDIVVIFASAYTDVIVRALREQYGYHGEILSLETEHVRRFRARL